MDGRGFIEVETPTLVPIASRRMAHPFITHHNMLGRDLYFASPPNCTSSA